VVIGEGPVPCRIVFLGEAPGKQEDAKGTPFIGRSGDLLRALAYSVGLREKKSYHILNILKCRPPDNRDPSAKEIANCTPFLLQQLQAVQPKVILAMGRFAQAFVLGAQPYSFRVLENTGKMINCKEVPDQQIKALLTFHPSYVSRNRNNEVEKAFISHLRRAKKLARRR